MILTLEEVIKDHQDSARDIAALTDLVRAMDAFIFNPCGENRAFLNIDLMKWRGMLTKANELHSCIEKKLAELKSKET